MEALFKFLSKLGKNNNKEWFDVNREHYLSLKEDFVVVVENLIESSSTFDPMLKGVDARKSLFRINKDIRFSKDKSPYKTNFGASIRPGGKKSMVPGYYLHIEPNASFLVAGVYMPEPVYLAAIRQEIDYNLDEFKTIVSAKDFKKEFGSIASDGDLVNPPKGYDKENPAIDLLKRKHFYAIKYLTNEDVCDKNFVKNATKTFKSAIALNLFLRRIKD